MIVCFVRSLGEVDFERAQGAFGSGGRALDGLAEASVGHSDGGGGEGDTGPRAGGGIGRQQGLRHRRDVVGVAVRGAGRRSTEDGVAALTLGRHGVMMAGLGGRCWARAMCPPISRPTFMRQLFTPSFCLLLVVAAIGCGGGDGTAGMSGRQIVRGHDVSDLFFANGDTVGFTRQADRAERLGSSGPLDLRARRCRAAARSSQHRLGASRVVGECPRRKLAGDWPRRSTVLRLLHARADRSDQLRCVGGRGRR